jgi:hypothetical protein
MLRITINNRNATSTDISSFFLQYGYHARLGEGLDITPLVQDETQARSSQEVGEALVVKLRQAVEVAQSSIAIAQQRQEQQTDRTRDPHPRYQVNDRV